MADAYRIIARKVGIPIAGNPRSAILELLTPIGWTAQEAERNPCAAAREITLYLDDLVRNP